MRAKRGLQRLARALELPQDLVMDLPRLTMLGNQQVLIENHRGIVEYAPEFVRVNLSNGALLVKGRNLTLGNLQPEQLLIEGAVEEIRYDA